MNRGGGPNSSRSAFLRFFHILDTPGDCKTMLPPNTQIRRDADSAAPQPERTIE
jgi:hypothetical protein